MLAFIRSSFPLWVDFIVKFLFNCSLYWDSNTKILKCGRLVLSVCEYVIFSKKLEYERILS